MSLLLLINNLLSTLASRGNCPHLLPLRFTIPAEACASLKVCFGAYYVTCAPSLRPYVHEMRVGEFNVTCVHGSDVDRFYLCLQEENGALVSTSVLLQGDARFAEASLKGVQAEWPVSHWYGKVLDALCKVRRGLQVQCDKVHGTRDSPG